MRFVVVSLGQTAQIRKIIYTCRTHNNSARALLLSLGFSRLSLGQTTQHVHAAPLQNEPAGQLAQLAEVEDVTLPTVPGGQLQAVYLVDPAADMEGDGHTVQEDALASEKVLAAHCVGDIEPEAQKEPAGQGCCVLGLEQKEPDRHALHNVDE